MAQTQKKVTELTVQERASQALSVEHTEADLNKMAAKYKDVTEIKDDTDYQLVKSGAIALGKVRVSIEKAGKAARDDANKFAKAVIAEERRLTGIISPEEDRLKTLRKAVDDAEARKAVEARQAEEQRIEAIKIRIASMQKQTEGLLGADSTAIQMRLDGVRQITITEGLFSEFTEQAQQIYGAVTTQLEAALQERLAFEEAQDALAQQKAEQEAREAAERAKQEEERKKIEAERLEAQRIMREAQEKAEAEKVRKEKERLEREAAERVRAEAEQKAAEAEAARQEALRPEKERLIDWGNKLRFIDGLQLDSAELMAIQSHTLHELDRLAQELQEAVNAL